MPGGWAGSTRKEQLPPDWARLVVAVKQRDGGRCTVLMRDGSRCRDRATDVDHVIPGDDHRMENLRAICRWHHARKSSAEGNAARARVTTRRPGESHPGLTG